MNRLSARKNNRNGRASGCLYSIIPVLLFSLVLTGRCFPAYAEAADPGNVSVSAPDSISSYYDANNLSAFVQADEAATGSCDAVSLTSGDEIQEAGSNAGSFSSDNEIQEAGSNADSFSSDDELLSVSDDASGSDPADEPISDFDNGSSSVSEDELPADLITDPDVIAGEEGSAFYLSGDDDAEAEETWYEGELDLCEDPEELFEGYASSVFGQSQEIMLLSTDYCRKGLTGVNALVYDLVYAHIMAIANGEETNTSISVPLADLNADGYFYGEDLGLSALTDDNLDEGKAALTARFTYSPSLVAEALLRDCPFEFYWCFYYYKYTNPLSASSVRSAWDSARGEYKLYYTTPPKFNFYANVDYAADNTFSEVFFSGTSYNLSQTIDPAKTGIVQTAAANARAIVEEADAAAASAAAAGTTYSDYDRLFFYMKQILSLSTYNEAATYEEYDFTEDNPWHLIWVFDGDDTTNVVCVGFSQAFQYLCELTTFNSSSIRCHSVTGSISAGAHMWNIVHMDDGRNYICDLTNCTNSSSVSSRNPEKDDTPDDWVLFMDPAVSGDAASGYTFAYIGTRTETFHYYSEVLSLYPIDELTLSTEAYTGAIQESPSEIANCSFTLEDTAYVYDGSACEPDVTVCDQEETLIRDTDYTVSYSDNIDAGSALVTVTGIGNYTGSWDLHFTIARAPGKVTLSSGKTVYNGSPQSVSSAVVTAGSGPVFYTYYMDQQKKVKTDTSCGAASPGSAPANAGTYYVTAAIPACVNYTSAVSACVSFTIEKAPTVVEFSPVTCTYTGSPASVGSPSVTGSSSAPQYICYRNSSGVKTDTDCGAKTTGGIPADAGTYYIRVYIPEDTNYAAGYSDLCRLTIKRAANPITAANLTRKYSSKKVRISAPVTQPGAAKRTYRSDNSSVRISDSGVITLPAGFIGAVTVTVTSSAVKNYEAASGSFRITIKPPATKLTSVKKKGSRQVRITWKKKTVCTGYQIQYARNASFTKSVVTRTVSKSSKKALTIRKLRKRKRYYFRIRTYKTVKGKRYYSSWSKAKSVKTR